MNDDPRATGYEPLYTLKPVARDLWIVDGPAIRFYHMPFSTRATVIRLADGGLWVHSPIELIEPLREEIAALGPVRHLVAPNWIHYAFVAEWQAAFPQAESWAAPGVAERAASRGMALQFDHALTDQAPPAWAGEIDQTIVKGSKVHREAVFFHRSSRALILTDLIENFEPRKLPWWMRPLVRLAGISAPRGHMPPDMRATFDKPALGASVRQMLDWGPERVILAHGACYGAEGAAELRRAFRFALR
ncbi:MAG: DUF4336 domain-containing protein [Pseudodonghicola sp.]